MKKAGSETEPERTGMLQGSQAEWIIGRFRGATFKTGSGMPILRMILVQAIPVQFTYKP